MLRKMLTLVALVVVAVSFGAGTAAACGHTPGHGHQGDGFSDGRLAG